MQPITDHTGGSAPPALGYSEVFRILTAQWGPPRRSLELPHWVSRDGSCLVLCTAREPAHGPHSVNAQGLMVLRCYSQKEVPFQFMAIANRAQLAAAVCLLAELGLGGGHIPDPPTVRRAGLRPLGTPGEARAAARAARNASRELRAEARVLIASGYIAAGVNRLQRARRIASSRPALDQRSRRRA